MAFPIGDVIGQKIFAGPFAFFNPWALQDLRGSSIPRDMGKAVFPRMTRSGVDQLRELTVGGKTSGERSFCSVEKLGS
jgi:hypothetical protein